MEVSGVFSSWDTLAENSLRSCSRCSRSVTSMDRITLIDSDGTVLYDSVAKASGMENHLSREEVSQALREGSGRSSHYSSTVLRKNLYYALRLKDGTVLRLSQSLSPLVFGIGWSVIGWRGPYAMGIGVSLLIGALVLYVYPTSSGKE